MLEVVFCIFIDLLPFLCAVRRYVWSGVIVLLGIGLNLYSKNRSKVNGWFRAQLIHVAALYSSRRMKYSSSVQFQV